MKLALFILTLPLFANTYTTNFPLTENPISEAGMWVNGGQSPANNWTNVQTTPGLAFGTMPPSTGNDDDSTALLTGTWGPTQTITAVVHAVGSYANGMEVEMRLRSAFGTNSCTGYELDIAAGYIAIVRWNGPLNNFTVLAQNTSATWSLPGATVTGTISGSTITIYVSGVQIVQATDSTYTTGNPGMGFFISSGGDSTKSDMGFTSYTATDNTYPWSGIVNPARAIDWSQAGVMGGIPTNRTQCGSTIAAYSGTPATINTAISSCGANQYVQLGTGTFNLSAGIVVESHNNVTVRGMGANQTLLVFSSTDGCQGLFASICVESSDVNWNNGPSNTSNWTAGYGKGNNIVTLATTTNLKIGNPIILDQLDDTTDDGSIFICSTVYSATGPTGCSLQGGGGAQRSGRFQFQVVNVTGCNGSVTVGTACTGTNTPVTISPPLEMPNWDGCDAGGGCSPQAWYATNPVTGAGIENLSVDSTGAETSGTGQGIAFFNATNSWVSGVRSIDTYRAHVEIEYSNHVTVQNSYFFLTQNSIDQSYGVDCFAGSDNLIVNNIFQAISGPQTLNGCIGSVIAYNYTTNNYYTGSAGWIQASTNPHTGGVAQILYEGNVGSRIDSDNFHGSHHFVTAFRNYYTGYEPSCWASGSTYATTVFAACTGPVMPIDLLAYSRFYNMVGNVLGRTSWQTKYESTTAFDSAIYIFGAGASANGVTVPFDANVQSTAMLWGNYDTFNAASRFVSGEVPSGLTGLQQPYANPVPANNTLPASFFYSSQPSWWPSGKAWPPIGPDVMGGNVSGVGGHAYTIPAQDCFLTTMGGPSDGTGSVLSFNAATCYSGAPPPSSGVSIGGNITIAGGVTIQ